MCRTPGPGTMHLVDAGLRMPMFCFISLFQKLMLQLIEQSEGSFLRVCPAGNAIVQRMGGIVVQPGMNKCVKPLKLFIAAVRALLACTQAIAVIKWLRARRAPSPIYSFLLGSIFSSKAKMGGMAFILLVVKNGLLPLRQKLAFFVIQIRR